MGNFVPPNLTKYPWVYHPWIQGMLHWAWILGFCTLLGWCLCRLNHRTPYPESSLSLHIENPHLYSRSREGNAFQVYAKGMDFAPTKNFRLTDPCAQYQLREKKLLLSSQIGAWEQKTKTLVLEKSVCLRDDTGQILRTDCATVFCGEKKITGSKPTSGTSPRGHFTSQGFSWSEKSLDLVGPVRMVVQKPLGK